MTTRKPLLVFDGDCSFCRRWILRWKAETGDAVDYEPYQLAAERLPDIPREAFERGVVLVTPGGTYTGAEAVFRALALGGRGWPLAAYRRLPGFAAAAEAVYRLVARRRHLFSRPTKDKTNR